ncbi:MAG: efflux RND transporter permease subunit [Oceanococcaceae bacterium]
MAEGFNRFLERYAYAVIRWRWLVLLASVVAIAGMGYGAQYLTFSTDYRVFFGKENPQLIAFDQVQNVYNKNDSVLYVVAPEGGNAFNAQTMALVEEMTEKAWTLPFTRRVDSITNYQHTEAQGDDLLVGDLVSGAVDLDAATLEAKRQIAIHEPLLLNRLTSESGHVVAINVTSEFPEKDISELPITVKAARDLRDEMLAKYPGHSIYMTGSNMMSNAFAEASQADIQSLYPLMYLTLIVIMWLLLRSIAGVVSSVVVIILSAAGAMGLAGWLGIGLTSPSVAAPVIITTLAIADSVHVLVTYFAERRQGVDKVLAMVAALRINFMAVFMTSVTTAMGFLTINFTDSPPLQDLGNITAMGVILAWAVSVTTLPALMMIIPHSTPKASRDRLSGWLESFGQFALRRRWSLLIVASVVSLGTLALLPKNEANDLFAHYFDPRIEFRTDTDYVVDNISGLYTFEFDLAAPNGVADPAYLAKLDAFKAWWMENPKTMHVASLSDIFKRLNKNMHGDEESWYRLPEDQELAAQYLLLYEFSLPFGLDLANTINIDKNGSRFFVVTEHLTSKETRALSAKATAWLDENAPEMSTLGVSPAVMFAFIAERNIIAMMWSIPLALAAISILLIFALRSLKFGLLSLIPNLLPLGMAFGIWGLYSGTINFTMSICLGMVMGIIVDDTIHFFAKYLRARRELGMSPEQAIPFAFRTVGTALVVTSIILVCGFLILASSAFTPNEGMSKLTAIAIATALIADFCLLPPLILMVDREKRTNTDSDDTSPVLNPETTHATA